MKKDTKTENKCPWRNVCGKKCSVKVDRWDSYCGACGDNPCDCGAFGGCPYEPVVVKIKVPHYMAGLARKTLEKMAEYQNPLEVIEQDEFNRPAMTSNYRERAIDKAIDLGEPFKSTHECGYPLVRRFIRVICPICQSREIVCDTAGGNADTMTYHFKCEECKAQIDLSIPYDGIAVKPKKEQGG